MTHNQMDGSPVGPGVGSNTSPSNFFLFFSYLWKELAERVGFEPTKGYKPLLVFKTSAFDHSATSPVFRIAPRIVLAIEPKHNISV